MATTKNERLDLRLPGGLKQIIERAATLSGQSVSSFILGTAVRRAREVIHESDVIELSDRDRDRLLAALDDSRAKPNAALRRAVKRYNAKTG